MKVSTHGKKRLRERMNSSLTNRNLSSLFKVAVKNGYSPRMFIDCGLKKYLISHARRNSVKVFQDYIFLYGNDTLFTVWRIPEKYLPVESFLKRTQRTKKS